MVFNIQFFLKKISFLTIVSYIKKKKKIFPKLWEFMQDYKFLLEVKLCLSEMVIEHVKATYLHLVNQILCFNSSVFIEFLYELPNERVFVMRFYYRAKKKVQGTI